jgi:hypothetical protein
MHWLKGIGSMLKPAVALFVFCLAGVPAPGWAQDGLPNEDRTASEWSELLAHDISQYNWCKKDAFDFGAIGTYRHLYVLSCLNRDVTSAIRVSN